MPLSKAFFALLNTLCVPLNNFSFSIFFFFKLCSPPLDRGREERRNTRKRRVENGEKRKKTIEGAADERREYPVSYGPRAHGKCADCWRNTLLKTKGVVNLSPSALKKGRSARW